VFGSKCYILRDRENLGKFDAKTDERIFLGYSSNSCAYKVFNKRTGTVMESINVVVDNEETGSLSKGETSQPPNTPFEPSDLITGIVKHPSSLQDEEASPPQVTSPQEDVPTKNPARNTNSSQDELDPADLPKEPSSHIKLNHPRR